MYGNKTSSDVNVSSIVDPSKNVHAGGRGREEVEEEEDWDWVNLKVI